MKQQPRVGLVTLVDQRYSCLPASDEQAAAFEHAYKNNRPYLNSSSWSDHCELLQVAANGINFYRLCDHLKTNYHKYLVRWQDQDLLLALLRCDCSDCPFPVKLNLRTTTRLCALHA